MAGSFSDFGTPSIDGQAVNRVMPMMVLRNAVQGMQQVSGRGVTEEFTTDTEASEIRVIRQKPITSQVRSIGSTTNGGFFNSDSPEESASDFYGLRILTAYDTNFDIAEVAENMFKPSILDATVINMAQFIAKQVNASTMAEQLVKALNLAKGQVAGEANKTNIVELDSALTDGSVLDSLLDGYSVLDDGDSDNGIDTFTYEGRCVLARTAVKRALPKGIAGLLNVGNFKAQNMLKVGGADPETTPNNLTDGFFGEIDSTPHYMTSSPVWLEAEKYIVDGTTGLPASTTTGSFITGMTYVISVVGDTNFVAIGASADAVGVRFTATGAGDGTTGKATITLAQVNGMLTHKIGTLRGMAFAKAMKVIDNPRGQGKRLQPLYRWGHETIFPKSVVLYGDATVLAGVADGLANDLAVLPPGSQA